MAITNPLLGLGDRFRPGFELQDAEILVDDFFSTTPCGVPDKVLDRERLGHRGS